MNERDHKHFSTFQQWFQAFYVLNIGKCHLKMNREKKYFLLNLVILFPTL